MISSFFLLTQNREKENCVCSLQKSFLKRDMCGECAPIVISSNELFVTGMDFCGLTRKER